MTFDWNSSVMGENAWWRIGAFFAVMLVGLLAGRVGRIALARSADHLDRRHRLVSGAFLHALARSAGLLAIALSFPLALAFLVIGENVVRLVRPVEAVFITLSIGFTFFQLTEVVHVWLKVQAGRTHNRMSDMLLPIVRTSLRITVVVLTLLQVIQLLTDKPLTSIIAGLGVGGLAVALAAQDTIKHFFGSIVLFTDKPFQVGDRIVVDNVDGSVEEVGFRSTRIRTLEGHLVTMPNGDLANKTVVNVSQRPHIRHRAIISLTYDTPPAKIRRAVEIISSVLEHHEGREEAFPPRVVFDELAASSLNILVMFWYHPADFWSYKRFVEDFNFSVIERLSAEGIDFAFPTQTVYLAGDTKRPLFPPHGEAPAS